MGLHRVETSTVSRLNSEFDLVILDKKIGFLLYSAPTQAGGQGADIRIAESMRHLASTL